MLGNKKQCLLDHLVDIQIITLWQSGTTKFQQIRGSLVQPGNLRKDIMHNLSALIARGEIIGQNGHGTTYPRQRVLDFMCHPRRHFANRGQTICLLQLAKMNLLQLLFGCFQFFYH